MLGIALLVVFGVFGWLLCYWFRLGLGLSCWLGFVVRFGGVLFGLLCLVVLLVWGWLIVLYTFLWLCVWVVLWVLGCDWWNLLACLLLVVGLFI